MLSNDATSMGKQINTTPSDTTSASVGASSSSQQLRTLKRLQAMLEDSDYVTHSVAASSLSSMTSSSSSSMINSASVTDEKHNDNKERNDKYASTVETTTSPEIDKLWT